MSRVHDALRRAEEGGMSLQPAALTSGVNAAPVLAQGNLGLGPDLFSQIREVPFTPSKDSHLIDLLRPNDAPAEEFRTLRTRLNHLQTQRPIHSIVMTSPSPAEGKSFAAVNLAITESQLDGNPTLLVDCDFRRPVIHNLLQVERSPGLTDYLQGTAPVHECIRRLEGSNLFIMPAGGAVVNPLELLNRAETKLLIEQLPRMFNWTILDSPPLLFAADANLLSTICSGIIMVVRIGSTTIDSITRAMQSLCEDNVLGVIVNGARRGELYSKYTYYHSYYYADPEKEVSSSAIPSEELLPPPNRED